MKHVLLTLVVYLSGCTHLNYHTVQINVGEMAPNTTLCREGRGDGQSVYELPPADLDQLPDNDPDAAILFLLDYIDLIRDDVKRLATDYQCTPSMR